MVRRASTRYLAATFCTSSGVSRAYCSNSLLSVSGVRRKRHVGGQDAGDGVAALHAHGERIAQLFAYGVQPGGIHRLVLKATDGFQNAVAYVVHVVLLPDPGGDLKQRGIDMVSQSAV